MEKGLSSLLGDSGTGDNSFRNIHPFGLLERTCSFEIISSGTNEILARTIHEDYVKKQMLKGETDKTNPSMVTWEMLPESLKESNRDQAEHLNIKLKLLNCGIEPAVQWDEPDFVFNKDEVEELAVLEHRRWVENRESHGWKYGEGKKDIERKTSPYIVPWEKLDEDIRELDRDTIRNIPRLLNRAGFRIYRIKGERSNVQ